MHPRIARYFCGLVCFFISLCSAEVFAQPAHEVLERVSQSVVKIEAGTSSATGFIWKETQFVVTSLHVIDGQRTITANYVNANGQIVASSPAVVDRVLKKSDLVLLRLQNPLERPVLDADSSPLKVKQSLDAVGFPLNIAGYSSTEVKVRFGGDQLRSILPSKVLQKIGEYPSTTLKILNLEGNLVPGLSGGPIVNNKGQVVGIVDGGLESGAIGISWGIPASELQHLDQSTDNQLPNAPGITELFAADLDANVGKTQLVGDIRLTKLRSRSFQQLAETADDKLGLNQLASLFNGFNPYAFNYDIYQDLGSGATIVVPMGADISKADNFTTVALGDPRMEMVFNIWRVQNFNEAQYYSIEFENILTQLDSYSQVFPDPYWSYLTPLSQFGVTVNRKAIYRNIFNGMMWQTDKYYFETLATNGSTLLAVAAVNHDNSPEMLQLEMWCAQGGYHNDCAQVAASRKLWAQMVLGVQFASFPQHQMQ
ncbi:S1 family peptidase [Neptunomonas qingdaonensis]|uniref:Trypsin-like peptidase domain-containing protein n=1 Tax=Neptunomonas qingdaonensis TaxID=1045558 RepID=A0A1I2S8B7_9GAMM|nr:serine protease [Neptunomonas qingdaonensis]SFG47137.1 Trypsin-like peptidase domain-containing protein [Neptunomonas qingdaonensis]